MLPAVPLLAGLALWTLLQALSAWNRWQWNQLRPTLQRSEAASATFLRRANGIAWLLSAGVAILLAVLHHATAPATPALTAALALVYVLGATISTLIYLPQIKNLFSGGAGQSGRFIGVE